MKMQGKWANCRTAGGGQVCSGCSRDDPTAPCARGVWVWHTLVATSPMKTLVPYSEDMASLVSPLCLGLLAGPLPDKPAWALVLEMLHRGKGGFWNRTRSAAQPFPRALEIQNLLISKCQKEEVSIAFPNLESFCPDSFRFRFRASRKATRMAPIGKRGGQGARV